MRKEQDYLLITKLQKKSNKSRVGVTLSSKLQRGYNNKHVGVHQGRSLIASPYAVASFLASSLCAQDSKSNLINCSNTYLLISHIRTIFLYEGGIRNTIEKFDLSFLNQEVEKAMSCKKVKSDNQLCTLPIHALLEFYCKKQIIRFSNYND